VHKHIASHLREPTTPEQQACARARSPAHTRKQVCARAHAEGSQKYQIFLASMIAKVALNPGMMSALQRCGVAAANGRPCKLECCASASAAAPPPPATPPAAVLGSGGGVSGHRRPLALAPPFFFALAFLSNLLFLFKRSLSLVQKYAPACYPDVAFCFGVLPLQLTRPCPIRSCPTRPCPLDSVGPSPT
jgi:hypothetical protein